MRQCLFEKWSLIAAVTGRAGAQASAQALPVTAGIKA